jgi:hypothetical protein
MLKILRSFLASLRSSAALGRASRLTKHGHHTEALKEARRGLGFLSAPYVNRLSPPEGSALLSLTMRVEQLAFDAKAQGASRADLTDSLAFLRLIAENPTSDVSDQLAWIPYLEAKLQSQD